MYRMLVDISLMLVVVMAAWHRSHSAAPFTGPDDAVVVDAAAELLLSQ